MADKPDQKLQDAAGEPPAGKDKETKPQAGEKAPKEGALKVLFATLSGREKSVIQIFVVVFLLLILDLTVIHPISSFLARLDQSITIEERTIPNQIMILKYKNRIMDDNKALEPLMTDSSLSQEEEIARFLREVERVSKEAGLFVSNINPVKVNKTSDTVYELSVDIDGTGGLGQIQRFMKTIEAANPVIRISGFSLKPQGKESEDLKCSFSILKIGIKKGAAPAPPK